MFWKVNYRLVGYGCLFRSSIINAPDADTALEIFNKEVVSKSEKNGLSKVHNIEISEYKNDTVIYDGPWFNVYQGRG